MSGDRVGGGAISLCVYLDMLLLIFERLGEGVCMVRYSISFLISEALESCLFFPLIKFYKVA